MKQRRETGAGKRVLAATAVILLAAALLIVGLNREDEEVTQGERAASISHVHGLGIDPADQSLLAGTHHGLLRIHSGGKATQVGESKDDLMGFTVAGPGQYLASGHPTPGSRRPAALGLIESKDGGRNWETKSLSGTADFHALKTRHGNVYGISAGELLVSSDKESWEQRNQLEAYDLAVSPTDPEQLLVTTPEGLKESRDGGRTFKSVPDSPGMHLLTWEADGLITGMGPAGGVYTSKDEGKSWEQKGRVNGLPAALHGENGRLYVAVEDQILVSSDQGSSFQAY